MPEVDPPGPATRTEAKGAAHDLVPAFAGSSSLVARDEALPAATRPRWFPIGSRADDAAARSRRSPILASFVLCVVLPASVAGVYYGFVASKLYVSEFRATVRSVSDMKTTGMSTLLGLAGSSQSANDANAVVQYIESRDALEDIDKTVNLKAGYAARTVDWLSRLRDTTTIEAFTRYWRRRVEAYYETTTGTIVVRVADFKPETAFAAATALLARSEALVNRELDGNSLMLGGASITLGLGNGTSPGFIGGGAVDITGTATIDGFATAATSSVGVTFEDAGSITQAGGFDLGGTLTIDSGATYMITAAS